MGRPAFMERVDGKKQDDEQEGNSRPPHALPGEISLLLQDLLFLALRVIKCCQFRRGTVLLTSDGRIEYTQDLIGCHPGRVLTASLFVGPELGKHVQLDIIERGLHTPVFQCLVEVTVVISSLLIALRHDQVVIGIDMSRSCLGEIRFEKLLVSLFCIPLFTQSLLRYSPHDLDTALVFVKVILSCISFLTVLIKEHLRTVDPVDGLRIATRIDICHTRVDRA